MNNQNKRKCPTCSQDIWQLENQYKPFCSSRCKLIDFGEWFKESRVIDGGSVSVKINETLAATSAIFLD